MADATLVDLVKITALTTGTGAVTLGDAVPGYRGVEALLDGAVYGYSIQQEAEYEIGRCTYLQTSNQIVRTPEFTSNGGTPINLQANASIAFVATAEDILGRDVLRPLYGYGAPTNNIGLIGQVYTDLNVPVTLYGPKTAEGWGVGVVLQGDPGAPGSAATYRSVTELKAADPAALFYALITSVGLVNYGLVAGNFTGKTDDVNVIKLDAVPLTTAALVRQSADAVTFRQSSSTAILRAAQDKLRETISCRDYNAKGDGVTNDTAALVYADAAAKLFGKDLFLPAGVYMLDEETRATTNWRAEAGTVIRYRGAAASFTRLVYSSGVDGITFENITFDGGVSADPTAWSAANYDAFTGASGLSVEGCKRPRIIRCRFINTRQHGLRVVGCTGPVIQGCTTQRSRGAFGDGFYLVSNIGLSISSCWADDYTRIGFVVDSNGDTILTNHKISLSSLLATNGHDASALYGGGEFNAGIWCEHTGDVAASDIFTANNTHRGINICTGSKTNGFPGNRAMITLVNCQTVGGSWGLYTYSLGTLPVVVVATNCTAKGARIGFEGDANHGDDSFTWIGCHADYDATSGTARGFATEAVGTLTSRPLFQVLDCTIARPDNATAQANLDDNGDNAATSDVGNYGAPGALPTSPLKLIVRNLRHVVDKPVYVRWYGTTAHHVTISDSDVNVRRGGSTSGIVNMTNCTTRSAMINQGVSTAITFNGGVILGRVTAVAVLPIVKNLEVTLSDVSNVFLLSNAGGKKIGAKVINCLVNKNVNANGAAFRFGFAPDSFAVYVKNCEFTANGVASPATAFVERASSVTVYYGNVDVDSAVTNIMDTDEHTAPEATPAGVTRRVMV